MAKFATRNDLPGGTRDAVIALFSARLADAVDLYTQAKQAHWTVRGPTFLMLHELFDEAAGEADEFADLLAERIAQLGGAAVGTAREVAKRSTLAEYPLDAVDGAAHVQALSAALATFGAAMRKAIDECARLGDQGSADICTEISRAVDKRLWFVESHAGR